MLLTKGCPEVRAHRVVDWKEIDPTLLTMEEQNTGPGTGTTGAGARRHVIEGTGAPPPTGGQSRWLRSRPMIVAFDADDTLWHNEDKFTETHRAFEQLLAPWAPADQVGKRLHDTETRNLSRYGYGAKAFMLSMTETALDVSDGAIPGDGISRILALGRAILDRPTELLDDVVEVLDALSHHTLMLITKGDLHAQHARIAESGLGDRFWRIEVVAEKTTATYARLLETHQVAVDDFVMVGNSLRSDVLPVLGLGGRGVHVPYHVTWAHEADHDDHDHDIPTLDRLADLPVLIEGWT